MPSPHDFGYDGGTVGTDIHKVRLAIGDTDPDRGVLPNKSNFSDAEIAAFIDSGGSWQRGVMYAFLALGARYANMSMQYSDLTDPEQVKAMAAVSRLAVEYRMQAEKWNVMSSEDGEQSGYDDLVGYAETDSQGNAYVHGISLAQIRELEEPVDLEAAAND